MENKNVNSPFFSVVLAVHNGMPYLPEALESVLAQTETDWECVIVDDASTDATAEVLSAFAARDGRVRVIRNAANRHVSASLNVGIAAARGIWIAHMDADDRFRPQFLERVRECIGRAEPAAFFVTTWVTVIDRSGEATIEVRLPEGAKIRRMMSSENFIYHVATVFPKVLWEKAGGYPEHFRKGVDRSLWRKFFEKGAALRVIPEALADYRIHDANLTSLARAHEGTAILSRQRHEWRASIYLKQGMAVEARRELRLLAHESEWSAKNRFYFALSFLPRSVVHFIMWEVRSRLRR